jgi:hypothetical protein
VENTAISKDGYVTTLRLERRYSKSVGADFVTGGLHDYRSTTEEGFYLTVRGGPSKDAKKLIECIRSSIKSLTGNFPSVMPPTKASGVIEFVFDTRLSEAEIMDSIMSAISVTELGGSLLAPLTPEGKSNETLTNIFWGLFLIWFGVAAALQGGNFLAIVNSPMFALGTGLLFIIMNLVRAILHLKISPLTIGLGALLVVIYAPLYFIGLSIPFLPALLIIVGVALVIGARKQQKELEP